MKRRSFLKLSALTTVGTKVPLTLVNSKDIARAKPGKFLFIRLRTNKENINFKLPVKKEITEDRVTWRSIKELIFEPVEDITIFGVQVHSPISNNWVDSPFPGDIHTIKGEKLIFTFNSGVLESTNS